VLCSPFFFFFLAALLDLSSDFPSYRFAVKTKRARTRSEWQATHIELGKGVPVSLVLSSFAPSPSPPWSFSSPLGPSFVLCRDSCSFSFPIHRFPIFCQTTWPLLQLGGSGRPIYIYFSCSNVEESKKRVDKKKGISWTSRRSFATFLLASLAGN